MYTKLLTALEEKVFVGASAIEWTLESGAVVEVEMNNEVVVIASLDTSMGSGDEAG